MAANPRNTRPKAKFRVELELMVATGIGKIPAESFEDYKLRLVVAAAALDDDEWDELTPATRKWVDMCASLLNRRKVLPPFPEHFEDLQAKYENRASSNENKVVNQSLGGTLSQAVCKAIWELGTEASTEALYDYLRNKGFQCSIDSINQRKRQVKAIMTTLIELGALQQLPCYANVLASSKGAPEDDLSLRLLELAGNKERLNEMLESRVEQITSCVREKGETDPSFRTRVMKAINEMDNDEWEGLEPPLQEWYNEASEAHNNHKALPGFEEFGPEDEDEEDDGEDSIPMGLRPGDDPDDSGNFDIEETPATAPDKHPAPAPKKVASGKAKRYAKGQIDSQARIKLIAIGNPKRAGCKSAKMWELYKDNMKVQEFLDAGGSLAWIRWDIKHGYIEII